MVNASFESQYGITIEKVAAHWGELVRNEMQMILYFVAKNRGSHDLIGAMDFSPTRYEEVRSSRVSALEGFLNVWNFHNPGAPVPVGMRELMQNGVESILLDAAQKAIDLLPEGERLTAVDHYRDVVIDVVGKADSSVVTWLAELMEARDGHGRPSDQRGFNQWVKRLLGF